MKYWIDLQWQMPSILLTLCVFVMLLADAWDKQRALFGIAMTGVVSGIATAIYLWGKIGGHTITTMNDMVVVDSLGYLLTILICVVLGATLLVGREHRIRHDLLSSEFYILSLLIGVGMLLVIQSGDLITFFIGVEMMSLGIYVLIVANRQSHFQTEAGLKYVLIGGLSTAILLYGIAFIYGATGSTNLHVISGTEIANQSVLLKLGVTFLLAAFAFKISAVPFHMWIPDVYQAAIAPTGMLMATGIKIAVFGGMLRIFGDTLYHPFLAHGDTGWSTILAVISIITLTVGNLSAMKQTNIKRMLGYSSIAHAGILLLAVAAFPWDGYAETSASFLYYLVAYTLAAVGVFSIVSWFSDPVYDRSFISDWTGFSKTNPRVAFAMMICLLSLGGMPPTAGFLGKVFVFESALSAGISPWIVGIAILNTAISVVYYFRIVVVMYMKDSFEPHVLSHSKVMSSVVFCSTTLVLLLSVLCGLWFSVVS